MDHRSVLYRPVRYRWLPYLIFAVLVGLWSFSQFTSPPDTVLAVDRAIIGRVVDAQGSPVADVEVSLMAQGQADPLVQTHSHEDGTYLLIVSDIEPDQTLHIDYNRVHFEPYVFELDQADLTLLQEQGTVQVEDTVLARRYRISFWIATLTFGVMLLFIATERFHRTLAALLAIAVIFGVSLVGGAIDPVFYIFDFERALAYVDFDVIFLLLGMMIVVGIIEELGVFQWLAFQAYRLSRGRTWLLTIILIVITAITSALLDNVTTMLLMTPITLQIALAMQLDPLKLLLPEVMASNIGGISTLIGTPTNILIGSYAGLGFNDFLVNLTPGVIIAEVGLIVYVLLRYRKDYQATGSGLSQSLLQILEDNARIEDYAKLRKAGIAFGGLILLFVFGEAIHLTPAVSAIIGAAAMLILVNPDIERMLGVVDWTTLVFFICLFMVIGAVQEVGLIFLIADGIGRLVGDNLMVSLLVIIWVAALLSGLVDNIPFALAMLPVVDYLTGTIPQAGNNVLFYGLSVGAAMGGNSSLIGASANLVTAGISERAGYPISFKKFLVVGLPATIITVAIGCIWLLIRF